MKSFVDKAVIVTGGGSGIGKAAALAFARSGAAVLVADVARENGKRVVSEIRRRGGRAAFVRTDVSREAEVKAMIEAAVARFGRLDAAFNNAGIEGPAAAAGDYSLEDWETVIRVNLTGVWLCLKYEIGQMLRQGGGAIVNMASILGHVGYASAPAYTTSKHGIVGLTKAAALDYAGRGIRVNAVCPGFIETPMLERAGIMKDPEVLKSVVLSHPLGRLGTSEEVAAAVLWLCSEEASFITGQSLIVDGGYVAR